MHRYQPRIHLIIRKNPQTFNAPVIDIESELHRTFVFPETVFTAVTAYQNQLVRLKEKRSNSVSILIQLSSDHQTENRLESVCKRIPRLQPSDRPRTVSFSCRMGEGEI